MPSPVLCWFLLRLCVARSSCRKACVDRIIHRVVWVAAQAVLVSAAYLAAPLAFASQATFTNTSTHGVRYSEDGSFFSFKVNPAKLSGAPDQSDLNQPLTAADRVFVSGPHFYKVGPDLQPHTDDDERVRFFGVNLSFGANFPARDQAREVARALRKLGFNAVRLHHLDTAPDNSSTHPRSVLTTGPYPSFNEEAINRLRHFIQSLAAEGLYVNLNLRVGFQFRPHIDGVPDYDRTRMKRAIGAPILVYHPRMIELQERYATELIQRLNLQGSPALAMVEINNESSLLAAWHRHEWNDAIPPAYRPILRERWHEWLMQRYGSLESACSAWNTCDGKTAQPELLSVIDANLALTHERSWSDRVRRQISQLAPGLVSPKTHLDSSAPSGRLRRVDDFVRFLANTDAEYFNRMRETVKRTLDLWVPVTGTQMSYGGALNFTAQADMDYLDSHFYIDHPTFTHGHGEPRDWQMWDESITGNRMNLLLSESFWRDWRKPFVISEFNQPYPSLYGAQILPLMAAIANLQDWDGLFFYEYDVLTGEPGAPANFALLGDWGKYVVTGQSARIFREHTPQPLPQTLRLPLPTATQAAIAAEPDSDALSRYISVRLGVVPEDAWQYRIAIAPDSVGEFTAPQAPQAPYASPGQALRYDPFQQLAYLTTLKAAGIFGRVPGRTTRGDVLSVHYESPEPHAAGLMLSTLDNHPIQVSRHLLLTLGSETVSSQPGSRPERPKRKVPHPGGRGSYTLEPDPTHQQMPSASRYAQGSAWLRRQEARVSWEAVSGEVTAYPLDGSGQRLPALPPERVRRSQNRLQLHLHATPEETSPWYEVVIDATGARRAR